jgi:P-type conjugative transfer protein TrbJ
MKITFNKKTTVWAVVVLTGLGVLSNALAEMPVIDFSNLFQNTLTATNSLTTATNTITTAKIEIQNAKNPLQFLWDPTNTTISQLYQSINTLDYFKAQTGGMQNYLALYQDANYYRSSQCFSSAGCSPQAWSALANNAYTMSQAQKKANDAQMLNVEKQQSSLNADAQHIATLQTQVGGAQGQMQAMQANNQLASAQANQLIQIRALMIAQQNAEAARDAAVANKQAMQDAADASFLSGTFTPSPVVNW